MYCSKCGKELTIHDKRYKGMCQGCFKYYRDGGTDNPLPKKGRIATDERGYVVCHICGRAYKRLGSHVKESHKMTMEQYKKKFGLCANARTTSQTYHKMMKDLAYKNGMDKQLVEAGKNTRIQKGDNTMRKGKEVRLQECLDRRDRYRKD